MVGPRGPVTSLDRAAAERDVGVAVQLHPHLSGSPRTRLVPACDRASLDADAPGIVLRTESRCSRRLRPGGMDLVVGEEDGARMRKDFDAHSTDDVNGGT